MSFILKFIRRRCWIGARSDILNVESQNPFIVVASFRLKRIYSLEREDGNCARSTIIRYPPFLITMDSHRK